MTHNIFPDRDLFIERQEKEKLLNQHGQVIWFTGLSGAGKSTLAQSLEKTLYDKGILTQTLDGDKIRNGLNSNLGFSAEDRIENIRRVAELARLFCDCGLITIAAFISPTLSIRKMAQDIIGKENYFEIYVSTPLNVCEQRDRKGLYVKAREGILKDFTGISAPYEEPVNPNLSINTSEYSVEEATQIILDKILPLVSKQC
jgi:adenylylsulfate kinase